MKKQLIVLLGALALVASPLVLTACQTETQTEVESDGEVDVDRELGVDEDVETETEAAFDSAGATFDNVGDEIQEGADAIGDAVDENVDLGENAEDQ